MRDRPLVEGCAQRPEAGHKKPVEGSCAQPAPWPQKRSASQSEQLSHTHPRSLFSPDPPSIAIKHLVGGESPKKSRVEGPRIDDLEACRIFIPPFFGLQVTLLLTDKLTLDTLFVPPRPTCHSSLRQPVSPDSYLRPQCGMIMSQKGFAIT